MENVTTSNWKAWISKNEKNSAEVLALNVTGLVDTHSTAFAFLERKVPQGFNPMILMLELKIENGIVPAKNPQVVRYSQPIGRKNQYTPVQILLQGKMIAEIKEIEVKEPLETVEK